MVGVPHSCTLLDGFVISARVSLLWQHSTNAKCQWVLCTRCMPGCSFNWRQLLLALENRCKGSNALYVRSPVVDEERMRPGHWLRSVLCVSFSALTLFVGWQEGHTACKESCATYLESFSSGTSGGRKQRWTGCSSFTWKTAPLNSDCCYHLRQGGYVIVVVCLFVCLSVINFAQKRPNGFSWNFQGRLAMRQWTNDYILVADPGYGSGYGSRYALGSRSVSRHW